MYSWRFFYEDDDTVAEPQIYLIYLCYLESAQIPKPIGKGIFTDGYNVYTSGSRDRLIAYLLGTVSSETNPVDFTGVWDGLAAGVEEALNERLRVFGEQALAKGTVKAYGAPTVEQFVGSYVGNNPTSGFDANYVTEGYNAEGYVYKVGTENYTDSYTILKKSGNDFYFPYKRKETSSQKEDSIGWWLARPSREVNKLCL